MLQALVELPGEVAWILYKSAFSGGEQGEGRNDPQENKCVIEKKEVKRELFL